MVNAALAISAATAVFSQEEKENIRARHLHRNATETVAESMTWIVTETETVTVTESMTWIVTEGITGIMEESVIADAGLLKWRRMTAKRNP